MIEYPPRQSGVLEVDWRCSLAAQAYDHDMVMCMILRVYRS
jgi:hypothetical protein